MIVAAACLWIGVLLLRGKLPAGTLNAPVEAGGAKSEAPQLSLKPGISAFAAVADSPLDEDANKVTPVVSEVPAQQETQPATQALPPPQVKPNAIGGPQLAQNLFHPPFPPMASSSSFTAECPPVRPSSAQEGLLSRIPNPEHAALLQQLQQFAPEASNKDLLRALHTHILQQAQLQQRNSAPATPQNGQLLSTSSSFQATRLHMFTHCCLCPFTYFPVIQMCQCSASMHPPGFCTHGSACESSIRHMTF